MFKMLVQWGCCILIGVVVVWLSLPAAAQQFSNAHRPAGGWAHLSRDPVFAGCQKQANARDLKFDERRSFIRTCVGK